MQRNFRELLLAMLVLLLPWLIASSSVWVITGSTFVVPLSTGVFEPLLKFLGHHRIIFHPSLIHPILFILSYLGPLLLVTWFLLLVQLLSSFPRKISILIALGISMIFFKLGAPGLNPEKIWPVFFATLLILPIVQTTSRFKLWALGTFGVIFSAGIPEFRFPILWTAFSLILGYVFHFIFVDKGVAKRKFRIGVTEAALLFFGLTALGFSVILGILLLQIPAHSFTPSATWWVSWILGAFCIISATMRPHFASRYFVISIFSQGLLLSSSLDLPCLLLSLWLILHIIFEIPQVRNLDARFPFLNRPSLAYGILGLGLLIASFQVKTFSYQREFEADWVRVVHSMTEKPSKGFLVIGDGLPFLSYFVSAQLAKSDGILLEDDETKLADFLDQNNLSDIIIEKEYLTDFWKRWIHDGKSPEVSNYSVISRMVSYAGKSVETKTLKIPEVKAFKILPINIGSNFVWLQKTNQL